tara:strand:- start:1228 stop:2409 length:1182 start_codon:yes stop_codon:yes gene_type:complete
MKTFFQFLSESQAVQQATRMGLKSDGHGGWYDNKGEFVAKTEKGQLKFYNKRQKIGQQDPVQSDKEKKYSQPVAATNEPTVTLEPPKVEKTKGVLTVAFGRFNPPTTGHQKLLDTVASSSDEDDYIIVPSRSNDPKKNPLDTKTKVSVMKQMFPKHSSKIVDDEGNRTIFDVLKKAHTDGYAGVRIVGGSDRVSEFEKLTNNYNKKLYDFDSIEVTSAGDRDPDSDNVEGMSASKQRKAAAEGDFESFKKGVPSSMKEKEVKNLYNMIRKGMNIKEGWNLWEIAPKFDWKNLRENYITEKIFNVGQVVENLNSGLIGRIIRRGTNYLICVTEDNLMFKSWIKDVSEAVVNGTHKQGVPPDDRLIGTDKHLKYVQSMVPGSSYGKQFINKYRKK